MENLKNILFVIDTIQAGGGAQKVLKIIATELENLGFNVQIVVLKKQIKELDFGKIKIKYILDENEKILPNSFKIINELEKIASEFNFLCSFMDFITTYFCAIVAKIILPEACYGRQVSCKTKFFCFTRSLLSAMSQTFEYSQINLKLDIAALKSADKVIANSIFCARELEKFGLNSQILYNPLISSRRKNKVKNLPKKYAIAIGRLHSSKNYVNLIKAFKAADFVDLELLILGDGEMKSELENLAKGLKIRFLGYDSGVFDYLENADFFVHISHFEGMSNAVMEAYSLSLPALLSDIEPNREIYGNNAIYCNPDDIDEITSKLKKINTQKSEFTPDLRRFSIENLRIRLLEIFS